MRTRLTDAERDEAAAVFETNRRFVEAVAARHASADDVPDVVQTVGLAICRSFHSVRGADRPAVVRAWLFRTTVSTAMMIHRRRFADPVELADPVPEDLALAVDYDALIDADTRSGALGEAVQTLTPSLRAAVCNALDGPSISLKQGAKRQRMYRARKQLRAILSDDPRFPSRVHAE